jgi:hypothetical protein
MFSSKKFRYFLLIALLPFVYFNAHAQNMDEKTYLHKMQLMDSLSLYKISEYDTLYYVSTSANFGGNDYKEDYYGWINKRTEEYISFLKINGKESVFKKKSITVIKPLPLNQETIDSITSRDRSHDVLDWGNFANNNELVLWLYKKGKSDYSKQLLPKRLDRFGDTDIRNGFGWVYYDAMLSAYSYDRDYPRATVFGEHLSGSVFKGFEYQKEAIGLTKQLKNNPGDFKTFILPDSLAWQVLKQKLTRKEQILYLADRLRLLNCIQPGQPAGISYGMYQYSIPYTDAQKLDVNYWKHNVKYEVINPLIELWQIKLSLNETELLLPYLMTDTFIPSYNYHRDFFPERNLHRLSWVVESLIVAITNKHFFDRLDFDSLTLEQKKAEIDKIKKWCDDNAVLSPEALTVKNLKTANSWSDFHAAMQRARQQKNDSLLTIIAQRFNDFNERAWPSNRGAMAQTMYELGNEKYVGVVKKWSLDTTDKWVNLWASMFLIKFDKNSYEQAMNELESVLKQCDGISYYPNAMDLLLSLNNSRALKLAEGILEKPGFQEMIYWDYYENFIRKLLIVKSDYTFNFLNEKLDAYISGGTGKAHKDTDQMLTQTDSFILTVDELKNDKPGYDRAKTNAAKLAYVKELKKWFKTQYALLKDGKPNELRLQVTLANAPVRFIDTYRR